MDQRKLKEAAAMQSEIKIVDDCIAKWVRFNTAIAQDKARPYSPDGIWQSVSISCHLSHDIEKTLMPEFVRLVIQRLTLEKLRLDAEFSSL